MCVTERKDIFKEFLSVPVSVGECLRSKILESSPRILAEALQKMSVMKYFLRIALTWKFTNNQPKFGTSEGVYYFLVKLRLEVAIATFQNKF